MKLKIKSALLYTTPIICLIILFHNGFTFLIPEIAKPVLLILNISAVMSFYFFYKRVKKNQDIVALCYIFLVPFVMFIIGFLIPIFYLPSESEQDENQKTIYYESFSYGPKMFVNKYLAEGIYLRHVDTINCRGTQSIKDCVHPKI